MLTRLFIENLATVEKQILEFGHGFTVLTGETGAGKSVIIKAINLVLGEKCPKDLIRAEKKYLSVEAVFSINDNPPVLELLNELDIEHEGELTIRRKVHLAGKNSIYINDYTFNLSKLSLLGEHLLDLHGQHSQQFLLKPATHIDYLDEFSGLKEALIDYKSIYLTLNQKIKTKKELEQSAVDRNREIDFIRFQIKEIDNAGFSEEEELQLVNEVKLLTHGEKLISMLSPITGWNSEEHSPLASISSALYQLNEAVKIDPKLQTSVDEIQSGLISIEEATSEINQYINRIELNPQRLEEINNRLAELDKLKRKYGSSITEITEYRETQAGKLRQLENLEISFGELEEEITSLSENVQQKAEEISDIRKGKIDEFEKLILSNLHQLGLERSRFKIQLSPLTDEKNTDKSYAVKGKDHVEFLIATNPGNPLKPLAKIASGGELSRIMLAIKTSLNQDISMGTMIFDEIDSGISGRVAETVGIKLLELGRSRQIICITHSPQIAAKAGDHLRVEKVFQNKTSKTFINRLQNEERIEEIARFLGGNEISKKTLSVARDMLTGKN